MRSSQKSHEWPMKGTIHLRLRAALPHRTGEVALYRDDIFLERAVVGERLRVAMGMSLRSTTEHAPVSKGVEAA